MYFLRVGVSRNGASGVNHLNPLHLNGLDRVGLVSWVQMGEKLGLFGFKQSDSGGPIATRVGPSPTDCHKYLFFFNYITPKRRRFLWTI